MAGSAQLCRFPWLSECTRRQMLSVNMFYPSLDGDGHSWPPLFTGASPLSSFAARAVNAAAFSLLDAYALHLYEVNPFIPYFLLGSKWIYGRGGAACREFQRCNTQCCISWWHATPHAKIPMPLILHELRQKAVTDLAVNSQLSRTNTLTTGQRLTINTAEGVGHTHYHGAQIGAVGARPEERVHW